MFKYSLQNLAAAGEEKNRFGDVQEQFSL